MRFQQIKDILHTAQVKRELENFLDLLHSGSYYFFSLFRQFCYCSSGGLHVQWKCQNVRYGNIIVLLPATQAIMLLDAQPGDQVQIEIAIICVYCTIYDTSCKPSSGLNLKILHIFVFKSQTSLLKTQLMYEPENSTNFCCCSFLLFITMVAKFVLQSQPRTLSLHLSLHKLNAPLYDMTMSLHEILFLQKPQRAFSVRSCRKLQ